MTLDIRGSLKNTKVSKSKYVVFDELLSNAIDSYLIKKHFQQDAEPFQLTVEVSLFPFVSKEPQLPLGPTEPQFDAQIICSDNGYGFGAKERKAFITKDTSYKDDLDIPGIGKCKGSGRMQFLHFFEELAIDSYFSEEGITKRQSLRLGSNEKEINENAFTVEDVSATETGTKITLREIKRKVLQTHFQDVDLLTAFSASKIRSHILVNTLQRLISLKDILGAFEIKVVEIYNGNTIEESLSYSDLPSVTASKPVDIALADEDGNSIGQPETFTVTHYKLNKEKFNLTKNVIALCAKSSIVKDITADYLRGKTLENNPVDGFYHIVLVSSGFLDDHVNEQRDDFDIPQKMNDPDLLHQGIISYEAISDGISEAIVEMITPPEWDKDKLVNDITQKFGITSGIITNSKVKIHYGDTEDSVANRVMNRFQKQVIEDTAAILTIKDEIAQSDPGSDDFREKINELSWRYTSSLKHMDVINLSQLVVRRAAILEILKLAIGKNLDIQEVAPDQRRRDESIIHNIFFPMQKDSEETNDHDTWILSEEYQYFDYIASDKALASYKWDNAINLFDADIDEELHKLLVKNYDSNDAKRPDIAIFSKEGVAIIIEFKAPGVMLDDHTNDLIEYSQLLAAKSNGKIKKVYGYLIGDSLTPNRMRGYTRFPNGKGWFGTEPIKEHTTGTQLGELYSEVLFYEDIVDRAEQRLAAFKDRLNLDFEKSLPAPAD